MMADDEMYYYERSFDRLLQCTTDDFALEFFINQSLEISLQEKKHTNMCRVYLSLFKM